MRLHSLFLVSLLAAAAVAAPVALRPRTVACQTGAYIVAARGTFEAQGEGRLAKVSAQIDARIAGSVDVALVYPANFIGYADSVVDGVENMTALIQAYVGACPGLPIVLLGYSQGAQVIGDTLIGDGSGSAGLDAKYLASIAAIANFGDPTHVAGLSFDAGNSTGNGVMARSNSALFMSTGLAPKMQSYCMSNDIICDGGLSITDHQDEVSTYAAAAVNFVVSKLS